MSNNNNYPNIITVSGSYIPNPGDSYIPLGSQNVSVIDPNKRFNDIDGAIDKLRQDTISVAQYNELKDLFFNLELRIRQIEISIKQNHNT